MWLYVPRGCYPSAPGSEVSTSGSVSLSQVPELWVTSSGTATRRPLSWRGWGTRPWTRLLSGMTLQPSTADDGVERWISSQRDFHVSPGPPPVPGPEPLIRGGSGRISRASLVRWDPSGSFWRMSQDSLVEGDSRRYSGHWPRSGSMRNGRVYGRPKLGHRTDESGSSSSDDGGAWPTPEQSDGNGGRVSKEMGGFRPSGAKRAIPLGTATAKWSTPRANEREQYNSQDATVALSRQANLWGTPRAIYGEHSGMVDKDHLTGQAIGAIPERRYSNGDTPTWPTPRARVHGKTYRARSDGHQGLTLEGRVTLWQTPVAYSARYRRQVRQKVRGEKLLPAQAEDGMWMTPDASPEKTDFNGPSQDNPRTRISLASQSSRGWMTPTGRDYKDGAMDPGAPTPTNSVLGRQDLRCGPQGRMTEMSGPESSPDGPTSPRPRLNPRFVTWMMGFPPGWADPLRQIGKGSYVHWEMRSSRQVRRTLSGSSGPDSR